MGLSILLRLREYLLRLKRRRTEWRLWRVARRGMVTHLLGLLHWLITSCTFISHLLLLQGLLGRGCGNNRGQRLRGQRLRGLPCTQQLFPASQLLSGSRCLRKRLQKKYRYVKIVHILGFFPDWPSCQQLRDIVFLIVLYVLIRALEMPQLETVVRCTPCLKFILHCLSVGLNLNLLARKNFVPMHQARTTAKGSLRPRRIRCHRVHTNTS